MAGGLVNKNETWRCPYGAPRAAEEYHDASGHWSIGALEKSLQATGFLLLHDSLEEGNDRVPAKDTRFKAVSDL